MEMNREEIIRQVLVEIEGPISDHPEDPGGRTAWGITERWFPELFRNGDPTLDMAQRVATVQFWEKYRLDEIKSLKIAGEMFEFGFNAGFDDAVSIVQDAYNDLRPVDWIELKVDGCIGVKTITMINKFAGRSPEWHAALYNAMNCGQGMWYRKESKRTFRRGLVAKRIRSETAA